MGGCATKPGVVKEQGGAPPPLEESALVEVSESKVEGDKEDEGKRTSLGHLFRESEKRREASENEEAIEVKETIFTPQEENKGEEEEQTKAQVHPAPDSETTAHSVEPEEVSAPTHEETPVPSSVPTSGAHVGEEKPVEVENVKEISEDSSLVAVEQKAEVVEEKGDAELEASSSTEEEDAVVLPSSTTEEDAAAVVLPSSTTEKEEYAALPSSTTKKEKEAASPSLTTEKEAAAALPSSTTEIA